MDTVVAIIQGALGFGALLALIRAVKGPTLADRIVAIDLVLMLLAGGLAAQGALEGSETFLAVLVVVALIAFVGTVLVARFIEWRYVP